MELLINVLSAARSQTGHLEELDRLHAYPFAQVFVVVQLPRGQVLLHLAGDGGADSWDVAKPILSSHHGDVFLEVLDVPGSFAVGGDAVDAIALQFEYVGNAFEKLSDFGVLDGSPPAL